MPTSPLPRRLARPGLRRRALTGTRALRALGAVAASAAVAAGCSAPAPPADPPQTAPPPAATASAGPAAGPSAGGAGAPAQEQTGAHGDAGPAAAGSTDVARIRALLASLPVKGRAPKTGYSRDQFGQAWSDDVAVAGGHNGCDTRNDILRRDLTGITVKPGTHGCTVLAGVLDDPYTGKRIDFTRGRGTSRDVQIDHVVALSDAWQKGAQQISPQQRRELANDPLNLQAVDGSANQQKGAGDAATWLPPAKGYRCTYVSRQVLVKHRYGLWVTAAEREAVERNLDTCGQKGPAVPPAPPPSAGSAGTAPAADSPAPAPDAGPAGPAVHYSGCAAARAAGAAPLHRGEPGYRPGLDGDGDGIACE